MNLLLMRKIDEQYTTPFTAVAMASSLRRDGFPLTSSCAAPYELGVTRRGAGAGHKPPEPTAPGLSLSPAWACHRKARPRLEHRHHLYPHERRFHVSHRRHGLGKQICSLLEAFKQSRCGLLPCRFTWCPGAEQAADLQHRSGESVYQRCLPLSPEGGRDQNQHGRAWPRSR